MLVLGGGLTALQVIRILGRKGIPQYAAGQDRRFVMHSRWHRPLPGRGGGIESAASLRTLLAPLRFERLVLLPCADDWVQAVSRLAPETAARFPSSLGPPESLDILTDKGRFADAMVHLGLPHPQTMVLRTPDDLRALGPEVSRDWFLKPRASLAFMTRFGVKAFRFTSLAEAWDLVARAREAGVEMMLQEYIPGPPTCHYLIEGFMDRTGAIRTRFARQRLRAAPPDFGDSSYMVSVPLGEVGEAREILEALLQKLRYRGIFQGEFKRDPRDGRFKLLEVNVRPYGEIGFAAACGVDLCEMAYRDALGLPVPTNAEYVVGRRGIIPTLDWKSCWREVRERRITPWSALGSWAGASQPFFAWDDPVPPLVDLWQAAQRRLGRTLRGLHRPPP